MAAPLSLDIRYRFQRYIEAGLSGREAARRLLISPATASRFARKIRLGQSLVPKICGRRGGGGILSFYDDFIIELVEKTPDITLFELRDALYAAKLVSVHPSTVAKTLRRLGYRYKKRIWSPMNEVSPMCARPAKFG